MLELAAPQIVERHFGRVDLESAHGVNPLRDQIEELGGDVLALPLSRLRYRKVDSPRWVLDEKRTYLVELGRHLVRHLLRHLLRLRG